jgi:fatty acid amide hydrolase 2
MYWFYKELLGDDGVLIFPSFISTALYPQEAMYNICNFAYVVIFNTLGLPVTQCPLGYNRNHLPVGLQVEKRFLNPSPPLYPPLNHVI